MSDHRLVDMTAAEAGAFLRKLCEMTASGSQDWDNMQAILEQFVGDAYKGGQRSRDAEVAKLQAENAELRRGEYVCRSCGIRKDAGRSENAAF